MSLVITTNGNGVTIADGINSPVNFVNAMYTWYFHNDVLFLTAGGSKFYAAIGQVTVDGNTPNNETDLNTALGAVFPESGGGATPGIDDVLAEGQALTVNRAVNLNGHDLSFNGGVLIADGGINTGELTWKFGTYGPDVLVPDKSIVVTINGVNFKIPAIESGA